MVPPASRALHGTLLSLPLHPDTPPSAAGKKCQVHTVKEGETGSIIAGIYGVSLADLAATNSGTDVRKGLAWRASVAALQLDGAAEQHVLSVCLRLPQLTYPLPAAPPALHAAQCAGGGRHPRHPALGRLVQEAGRQQLNFIALLLKMQPAYQLIS